MVRTGPQKHSQDGTATATISGSSDGATNTVYYMEVGGSWGSGGSRSGNGDVELDINDGYYWAYVESVLNSQEACSAPDYFGVSSSSESVYVAIQAAVVAAIKALSLSSIGTNVTSRKMMHDRNLSSKPVVVVAPSRADQAPPLGGTNISDDIIYSVGVGIVDDDTQQVTDDDLPELTLWREQVRKAFHNKRLAGVTSVYNVTVTPGAVSDFAAWQGNKNETLLVLNVYSREQRA